MKIYLSVVTTLIVIGYSSPASSQTVDNVALLAALLNTSLSDTLYNLTAAVTTDRLSEDGKLNFTGLATKYGLNSEEHEVITEDGYILTLFRIPGNVSRPILLVHGATPTSDCWIIRGEGSLAIALANQDYDVWAISLRGTRYSRRNLYVDPDEEPSVFFNITFYDQGVSDVPLTIDYILSETVQTELTVVAHSSGTSSVFAMSAELPEYNDKVKLFIAMAPIVYLQFTRGLTTLSDILNNLGIYSLVNSGSGLELFSHEGFGPVLQAVCLESNATKELCRTLIFSVAGLDAAGFESDFLPTFLGHYPGGTTTKNVQHATQIRDSNRFARFDYGLARNLIYYNSILPPLIDLSKVTMKTALLSGNNDYISSPLDALRLRDSLPNVVQYLVLPYEDFNHIDFVYSNNMTSQLFPYVFDLLNAYV